MKLLTIALLVAVATASAPRRRVRRLFQDTVCAEACAEIYAPVCGSDGVTYDNLCFLEKFACDNFLEISVASEGACPDSSTDEQCPSFCPANYDPVCGSDGLTYASPCQLGVTNCLRAQEGNLAAITSVPGACGESPCAGFLGTPCDRGFTCLDVATDDCDPENGGFDCIGYCQPSAVPEEDPCDFVCMDVYIPVCGSDGVTYANECSFEGARCRLPEDEARALTFTQGECADEKPIDCICPAVYRPVCGTNGLSYSNSCVLGCAAANSAVEIQVACDGQCPCTPECNPVCAKVYMPVCGSDGVTYGNQCMFDFVACQYAEANSDVLTSTEGECGVDPDGVVEAASTA